MALIGVVALGGITGCGPTPSGPEFSCAGGSGQLQVSPGVTNADAPNAYTLTSPAPLTSCTDHSGIGLTGATIEHLQITFPSIGCLVTSGTSGDGSGNIRWSDGTRSSITAHATLESALRGTLHVSVTSGHFAGTGGSSHFEATLTTGDCLNQPATGESVTIGPISLT